MKILKNLEDLVKFCQENNFECNLYQGAFGIYFPSNYYFYYRKGDGIPNIKKEDNKITISTFEKHIDGFNMVRTVVETWESNSNEEIVAIFISNKNTWTVIVKHNNEKVISNERLYIFQNIKGVK